MVEGVEGPHPGDHKGHPPSPAPRGRESAWLCAAQIGERLMRAVVETSGVFKTPEV